MNRDEIIQALYDSGVIPPGYGGTENQFLAFERFAEIVAAAERNRIWTQDHWTEYERAIVAAEREACAEACEGAVGSASMYGRIEDAQWAYRIKNNCQRLIRARGNDAA